MNVLANLFNRSKGAASASFMEMYPDAVLVVYTDGEIYRSNKRAQDLFMLSKYELERRNISDIMETGILVIDSVLSNRKVQVGKMVRDDGRTSYLEVNASVTIGTTGKRIIVTFRDATEEYIQNADIFSELEELKTSNVDKNEFLIKLSNELQSPLHSIIGFSQALLENLGGALNEKQEKYISIINRNSTELFSLLSKIITISQYENRTLEIELKYFDLIDLINNVLMLHKKAAGTKNITFCLDYDELARRNCFMDENLLKTTINNLVEIMIRHGASDALNITLTHPTQLVLEEVGLNKNEKYDEKSFVMFSFSTGNFNINQNEFYYLSEPYVQIERNNKKYVDTALALAIVKNVVALMRGKTFIEARGFQGINIVFIIRIDQAEF